MKVQFLNLDLNTKEFEDKFSAYLSSLHRQVKAKNILDRTFIYMWDEMTGGHYDAMQKTVGMVRKYAPGIKSFATGFGNLSSIKFVALPSPVSII